MTQQILTLCLLSNDSSHGIVGRFWEVREAIVDSSTLQIALLYTQKSLFPDK